MPKVCFVLGENLSTLAHEAVEKCRQELTQANLEVMQTIDPDLGTERERTRIHDIREAQLTLKHALADIESGYRFDDDFAQIKKETIAKAVKTLSAETSKLIDILRNP